MYEKCNAPDLSPKRSEYANEAIAMANAILLFSPDEQNQMIQIIRETVACKRNEEIERLMKQYEFLKQSMNGI